MVCGKMGGNNIFCKGGWQFEAPGINGGRCIPSVTTVGDEGGREHKELQGANLER